MSNDQPVEFYRDAETGANRARSTMKVKITMSPYVAHMFDEATRERERLQRQVDDLHGAAGRLFVALKHEGERTHVAMSRETFDAAQALVDMIQAQNDEDTAIMVKTGHVPPKGRAIHPVTKAAFTDDGPPEWTAELEAQYQALGSVYGEMVKATNDMDELRALAESVCTSPFTGYAVEALVDWLESHPRETSG